VIRRYDSQCSFEEFEKIVAAPAAMVPLPQEAS